MRITIEDLESLKDLNDELEENHVETERQLNEEIRTSLFLFYEQYPPFLAVKKETDIREQARQIQTLEDTCDDYENTISQFRELVVTQQS